MACRRRFAARGRRPRARRCSSPTQLDRPAAACRLADEPTRPIPWRQGEWHGGRVCRRSELRSDSVRQGSPSRARSSRQDWRALTALELRVRSAPGVRLAPGPAAGLPVDAISTPLDPGTWSSRSPPPGGSPSNRPSTGRSRVRQEMLLGIHAHVQNDMAFVSPASGSARRTERSRKPDHDAVIEVLNRAYAAVTSEVGARYDSTMSSAPAAL